MLAQLAAGASHRFPQPLRCGPSELVHVGKIMEHLKKDRSRHQVDPLDMQPAPAVTRIDGWWLMVIHQQLWMVYEVISGDIRSLKGWIWGVMNPVVRVCCNDPRDLLHP